jgi:hypothetical protein
MTEHPSTDTAWHAGPDLLRQYAAGWLDPVGQAAVETHLERCTACQRDAAALVTPTELAPVWDRVLETVRTPDRAWPMRALRRFGVPEVDLVVLRASTNLVVGLCIAAAATIAFAITAAQLGHDRQQLAYLAIAPLLPALLVASAYDTTDPLREISQSTPYSKLRIALLRTVVAVLAALPLVLVMAMVPNINASLAAWLLPALAIALVLLVLLSWLSAAVAIGGVATAWLLAVTALQAGDELATVTQPVGQILAVVVIVLAAGVLVVRLGVTPPQAGRA